MQETISSVVERVVAAAEDGSLNFGQIVGVLMRAGIESYHVDYRAARITYYAGNGETFTMTTHAPASGIADVFDSAAIQEAIRGSQRGDVSRWRSQSGDMQA